MSNLGVYATFKRGCWEVVLLTDGSFVATSDFKRKVNYQVRVKASEQPEKYKMLPKYICNAINTFEGGDSVNGDTFWSEEGEVQMVCPLCGMTSTLDIDEYEEVFLLGEVVVCDSCGEGYLVERGEE